MGLSPAARAGQTWRMPLDSRLTPARPDLADARLRGTVEAARFVAGEARVVVAPLAPLRRAPADDAPLDSELLAGERARAFETKSGWSWVQAEADGYVGYAPQAALAAPGPAPTHRVCVLRTHVYPRPDVKAPPVAWLPFGARVAAAPHDARFVALGSGGYAIARHLVAADSREADFVAVAERFLGAPYLWGGRSANGLDCSGLVQLSLAACGIAAPRDSDQQEAALGRALAPGEAPRRGDLVFWKGHVATLRDAVTVVHATGHSMLVVVEPLADVVARAGAPSSIRRL
jgi:cell wall-associated NlpC family hydrolase